MNKVFIKQGLKAGFKSKWRTILFIVLLAISSLFFNFAFSSMKTLEFNQSEIPTAVDYDYGMNIMGTNADYSDQLTMQFYPSYIFDDERIQYLDDDNNLIQELPTFSIGENVSDKENKNQNGFLKSISSDDVETIVDATGTEKIKQINFTINKQSTHYQNSIVAKILSITDENSSEDYAAKFENIFENIFVSDKSIFQKNISYTIDNAYANYLAGLGKETDDAISLKDFAVAYINPNENSVWTDSNHSENILSKNNFDGYHGQIGSWQNISSDENEKSIVYFSTAYQYLIQQENVIDQNNFFNLGFSQTGISSYEYNKSSSDVYIPATEATGDADATDEILYDQLYNKVSSDYFLTNWFTNFYLSQYIGQENNLDIMKREQLITWDIAKNKNYKVINSSDVIYDGSLKIISALDEFDQDSWQPDQVLVSPGFFKQNKLKLGQRYAIGQQNVVIVGIATDSYNVYPTVHDSDYIGDSENDAVFYVAPSLIKNISETSSSTLVIQNLLFFKNEKNNFDDNFKNFSKTIFENQNVDVEKVIKDYSTYISFKNGSGMFKNATFVFEIVIYFFAVLFLILAVTISLVIVKDIVDTQRVVIGNLKANGANFMQITFPYYLYTMLIILIAVPIGFGLSIAVTYFMSNLFENFFSLGFELLIDIKWFAILFIGLIIFLGVILTFLLIRKVNVPPLNLIHETHKQKRIKVKKANSRVSSFSSRIASAMFKDSWVKLTFFAILFFISTVVMVISSIFVVYVINYSNNKYYSYDYNSKSSYSNLVVGNPFNKITTYDWDESKISNIEQSSLLPAKVGDEDLKTYLDENKDTRVNIIENLLFQSIEAGYNKNISLKYFDYIANTLIGYSDEDRTDYLNISEFLSLLLGELLPKAIGMESISYENFPNEESRGVATLREAYIDVWKEILTDIANQKLNDEAKVVFSSNENDLDQFTFSFNTTPYSSDDASTYTSVHATIGDSDDTSELIGQNADSKYGLVAKNFADITAANKKSDGSVINVLASKKFAEQNENAKTVTLKSQVNELQFLSSIDDEENENYISFSDINNVGEARWYYYDEDGNLQNLFNNDQYSFLAGDTYTHKMYDTNGNRYLNVNDIVLRINQNDVDEELWTTKANELLGENKQTDSFLQSDVDIATTNGPRKLITSVNADGSNWYEIHPFSYSFDGSDNDVNFSDFSKTWYDYATSANLIKTNAVTKEIKLNIVGTFKNYDSNNFIADQAALNQWLGLSNDNSYFNGLFTNQNLPTDLEWNYGLINTNGNISINAVSHFANKSLSVDYVGFEKSIIQRLIKIALQIGIVIYILLFVALIVSLSFVIKMFVYQFKQFILVLRATGYSFKTINWVILVQLVPMALIGWAVGLVLSLGGIEIVADYLSHKLGNTIPIGTGISLLPITLGLLIIMFAATYWVIMRSIRRIHVSAITDD
jgi:putative ABC transport system permease protein